MIWKSPLTNALRPAVSESCFSSRRFRPRRGIKRIRTESNSVHPCALKLTTSPLFTRIEIRYRPPMPSLKQEMPDRDLYSGLIRLHILHHAAEEPIFGLGMAEELAHHGYKLSLGTLYPLL